MADLSADRRGEPADPNPYAPPRTLGGRVRRRPIDWRRRVVVAMLSIFATGFVLQWAGMALRSAGHPGLSDFLMTRFGWNGAGAGMWPSIFLGIWLFQRAWFNLVGAAFMCLFVAGQETVMLIKRGTTDTVTNPFHDRLHDSWLFAVAPMVIGGLVCLVIGITAFRSRRERVRTRRSAKRLERWGFSRSR